MEAQEKKEEERQGRLSSVLQGYADSSTVHGVGYVLETELPKIDRIIYGALIVIYGLCAGYLISLRIMAFIESTVIISLGEASAPVNALDFPAVTICSQGVNMEALNKALHEHISAWKLTNIKESLDDSQSLKEYLKLKFNIKEDSTVKIFDILFAMSSKNIIESVKVDTVSAKVRDQLNKATVDLDTSTVKVTKTTSGGVTMEERTDSTTLESTSNSISNATQLTDKHSSSGQTITVDQLNKTTTGLETSPPFYTSTVKVTQTNYRTSSGFTVEERTDSTIPKSTSDNITTANQFTDKHSISEQTTTNLSNNTRLASEISSSTAMIGLKNSEPTTLGKADSIVGDSQTSSTLSSNAKTEPKPTTSNSSNLTESSTTVVAKEFSDIPLSTTIVDLTSNPQASELASVSPTIKSDGEIYNKTSLSPNIQLSSSTLKTAEITTEIIKVNQIETFSTKSASNEQTTKALNIEDTIAGQDSKTKGTYAPSTTSSVFSKLNEQSLSSASNEQTTKALNIADTIAGQDSKTKGTYAPSTTSSVFSKLNEQSLSENIGITTELFSTFNMKPSTSAIETHLKSTSKTVALEKNINKREVGEASQDFRSTNIAENTTVRALATDESASAVSTLNSTQNSDTLDVKKLSTEIFSNLTSNPAVATVMGASLSQLIADKSTVQANKLASSTEKVLESSVTLSPTTKVASQTSTGNFDTFSKTSSSETVANSTIKSFVNTEVANLSSTGNSVSSDVEKESTLSSETITTSRVVTSNAMNKSKTTSSENSETSTAESPSKQTSSTSANNSAQSITENTTKEYKSTPSSKRANEENTVKYTGNAAILDMLLNGKNQENRVKIETSEKEALLQYFESEATKETFVELFQLLWYSSLPCFKAENISDGYLLKNCRFQGKEQDCRSLFKTIPTDEGLCCAFNNHMELKDTEYKSLLDSMMNETNSKEEIDTPKLEPGISEGLSIIIDKHSDLDSLGSIDSDWEGFHLYVGHSQEFPAVKESGMILQPGYEHYVEVTASSTVTDEDLRSESPEKRKCRFEDENEGLHTFKSYSKYNCLFECAMDTIQADVGCTPWYLPHKDVGSTCNPWDYLKFTDQLDKFNFTQCNCLTDCSNMEYQVSLSSAKYRRCDSRNFELTDLCRSNPGSVSAIWADHVQDMYSELKYNPGYIGETKRPTRDYYSADNLKKEIFTPYTQTDLQYNALDRDIAIVHVFAGSPTTIVYSRSDEMNVYSLIASIGGYLALFLGFSMISLLEIIYWFLYRVLTPTRWFDKPESDVKQAWE